MSTDTIVTIIISVLTSGITAFAIISYRMGRYSEKIDQLEKCNLNTRLSTLEGRQLTKRNSPVDLTENGNNVLNDSSGKSFIDDNYNELKGKVESKSPTNSYDIQEFSKHVIQEIQDDVRMDPVKEYLFKEGMEIQDIIEVLGIYLRNKILEEKHIAVGDIDNHH